MEWQHATADYKKVLEKGISGIIEEINDSLKVHTKDEEIGFLNALKDVANALIGWAHKCSERAKTFAETVENKEYTAYVESLEYVVVKPVFENGYANMIGKGNKERQIYFPLWVQDQRVQNPICR